MKNHANLSGGVIFSAFSENVTVWLKMAGKCGIIYAVMAVFVR